MTASGEATPSAGSAEGAAKPAGGATKQAQEELMRQQVEAAKKADRVKGLSEGEVERLRAEFGLNELPEKKRIPLLVFLSYFWGPMPVMIWVAIIIELIKGILTGEGWEDFAVLMVLQFANAVVGFIEENNAGNAIAALKNALKPQCYVLRDGAWSSRPARELVPGDVILLKLGDVIPADAILCEGHGKLQVDQAALTGESLPVTKDPWEKLLMGSAVKRGEAHAVISETGKNTFLGKAAGLMASVESGGHLQQVLLKITMVLLVMSVVLCAAIFARMMTLPENPNYIDAGNGQSKVMQSLSVVIVILVASIPIAIEVVCTSTLAVGSHMMARKKVIVARLSAIEELAGMSILCSDKTGTLTLNKLSLREPILLTDTSKEDTVFYAALASKRDKGSQDAIDACICANVQPEREKDLDTYKEEHFEPFNPTDKRTLAQVVTPSGEYIEVSKGAPHIILRMSHNAAALETRVKDAVQELADRGFRALGVGINRAGRGAPPKWEYLGVLSLFDPPRHDTKATIAAAIDFGIEVKMVTGDHTAIAKETCRELGMGTNILNTEVLNDEDVPADVLDKVILEAHGFAEVMPEHKFQIVARLREQGFVVGMTGDGVNDAPALKRADVGIAVAGATDAARAAADLVLTEEGLGVIIDAIFESRKIFQRMRNYIIYRIACTLQLLLFFFFAILVVDPDTSFMFGPPICYNATQAPGAGPCTNNLTQYNALQHAPAFTLPVISLVIITILNDGCMITISHDNVAPERKPQKWNMLEMTLVATILGVVACLSSLLLLAYCMHANYNYAGNFMGIVFGSHGANYIYWDELGCIMYLKISISDFLTLFSARTRGWFWERRPGLALGIAALVATACSTLFSLFWDGMFQNLPDAYMYGLRFSDGAAIGVWIYCLLWFMVQDICKVGFYWVWDRYFALEEQAQEAFVKRHSLDAAAGAAAVAELAAGGTGNAGGTPAGTVGSGSTFGRRQRPQFLPDGVDLTAIAKMAASESVRVKTLRAKQLEKDKATAGVARLQEIASGRGGDAPATAAAPAPEAAAAPAPSAGADVPVKVTVNPQQQQ